MKKNVMMRLASVLLIAVLISTSAISGTYAKYVTSDEGSDSARVAKWGVSVTPNGEMFLKDYTADDTTFTVDTNSVESSDSWKLVAPGTTHGLTEVQLTGTPEVATRVSYDATVTLSGWSVAGNDYCPVYFTVENETYGITDDCGIDDLDHVYTTVAELVAGVEGAIESCVKDYAPNTDLSTVGTDAPTVTWNWPFYTSDDNDVKDTALGDAAANGYPAGITISVVTTVTQID